jgi:hypothetical protein
MILVPDAEKFVGSKARPVRMAVKLPAISGPIVCTVWDPQLDCKYCYK